MRFIIWTISYGILFSGFGVLAPLQGSLQVGAKSQNMENSYKSGQPEIIRKGESVGNLRLGMERGQLDSVFRWRAKPDEVYSHNEPCVYEEVHWLDIDEDAGGVFAYLQNGQVYEIKAESPRFVLSGVNIRFGATLPELKKAMPEGKLYRLTNSATKVNGGRDVYYWVAPIEGISFGLFYNSRVELYKLESITVFSPGSEFRPDGCLQESHTLLPQSQIED